ncbi:MAG: hypothetical protein QM308_07445 [Bacillota bacterium]|nr:hypothetical protein [Bacillota bacterium]
MKKNMTLTVVLLVLVAVIAIVGFVQKSDVQKKLDEATAQIATLTQDAEAKVAEAESKTAQAESMIAEADSKAAEAKAELAAYKTEVQTKASELRDQIASLTDQTPAPEDKYGFGLVTRIGSVAEATAEEAGAAQVDTTVCALVLDAEGKIKSANWDMQQTMIQFSAEGKPVDLPEALLTRLEKGPDSEPAEDAASSDWSAQVAAFAEYVKGKTVEEALNMPVVEREEDQAVIPDVEELKESVTIAVGDLLEALRKAAENAK